MSWGVRRNLKTVRLAMTSVLGPIPVVPVVRSLRSIVATAMGRPFVFVGSSSVGCASGRGAGSRLRLAAAGLRGLLLEGLAGQRQEDLVEVRPAHRHVLDRLVQAVQRA